MVSMPKNPFTPERQEALKENAVDFLATFTKEYLKAFGFCLLDQAIKKAQPRKETEKKLKYRGWTSVPRPELFSGYVYFKSGDGPGTWSKWQRVYIAETQKYNIEVYKTEEDFKKKKTPKNTVNPCGYNIIKDVPGYYKDVMQEIGPDMGMTDAEIEGLTTLSPYAWAYVHPLRKNFVFQLHKAKEPSGCCCFGGGAVADVDDAGKEEAKDRPKYLFALERCVKKSTMRDKSTIKGKAFDRTCKKMTQTLENLHGFSDDGTEAEILTDMIIRQCLTPMQKDMLADLGGVPAKFKISMWMKARGMVLTGMENVVKPGWAAMDKAAGEASQKIEPTINSGMAKIVQAREEAKDKVRKKLSDKMGEALGKHVSPYLTKLFEAFDKPISKAFLKQRIILEMNVPAIDKLPKDEAERNRLLDKIPRTKEVTRHMDDASEDIVGLLEKIKEMSDEVFGYLNVGAMQQQADDALLKVLDAAICTMERDITAKGRDPAIKDDVIKQWEHDVQIVKVEFIKEAMRAILLDGVKQALSSVVDPILDPIDEMIPEGMRAFLSARGLYEELMDLLVGEPIDKMVDARYPTPQENKV